MRLNPFFGILIICVYTLPCIGQTDANSALEEEPAVEIPFTTYDELIVLFDSLSYTPEVWNSGVHEVPRLYMTKVPTTWGSETADKLPVDLKKRLFVQAVLPLILTSNESILEERELLLALENKAVADLSLAEIVWLRKLAIKYRVLDEDSEVDLTTSHVDSLKLRVDIIPVSLAISQTALESGWGTSRFAQQGNALFGQMSWGKDVITPYGQDPKHGKRGLKIYDTPFASVRSYMQNLNSHYAYGVFRERRAAMRENGNSLDSYELASTLINYSTRREEYIDHVLSMIRSSNLQMLDAAFLSDDEEIFLVPETID